jgi:hypothetical protein
VKRRKEGRDNGRRRERKPWGRERKVKRWRAQKVSVLDRVE